MRGKGLENLRAKEKRMLDVTATLEETRREAYAAMLRDTLDSLDWCAAELNSVSEMRFDALRCLGWMTRLTMDSIRWRTPF